MAASGTQSGKAERPAVSDGAAAARFRNNNNSGRVRGGRWFAAAPLRVFGIFTILDETRRQFAKGAATSWKIQRDSEQTSC